jgi:hypothetical protein
MRFLVAFGRFWYDFIVGDDWRLAIGAVIGIALTALVDHQGIPAWWVLPTTVAVLLAISLTRPGARSS